MLDQRKLFIKECLKGLLSFSEICELFGVSRTTGYKWLKRFRESGYGGLEDLRKSRHTQECKTPDFLEDKILKVKAKYPSWGPRKIYAYLNRKEPNEEWPSTTTFGNILNRNGLVNPRKKRIRYAEKSEPLAHCKEINDVWGADFKGGATTKDRILCDPFTVTDAHSRFILFCSKLHSGKFIDVWDTLQVLFHEYGLPVFLRHDNGPPFASSGIGRLSKLSVHLIKVGVIPEWIDPGKPYQNGRHERMHGVLKSEASMPLELTLAEQQMKFHEFIRYYNYERPHEGIGNSVPGDLYRPSNRVWDGKLRSPDYEEGVLVKKVRSSGQISWRGKEIFIGKTLCEEYIAIQESHDNETWLVYYGPIFLGHIDQYGILHTPRLPCRVSRNYHERCY